jgi:HSP20 family molecular chaperone IbpA
VTLAVVVAVEAATAGFDRGLLRIVLPLAERPPEPSLVAIEVRRIR